MPTYEYRCPKGHEFELFQRMSDEPVAECPECGKKSQRLLSAGGGLVFKGSGFYITDYRSDSYKSAEKKDGTATSSPKEGGEKGGPGKSEKKSEKKASDSSAGD
jgi:putative FmdB family regulatory protein